MKALTRTQVIQLLRRKQGKREQKQFAAELGISAAYLSDLYNGKREPGPAILDQFGLVREVIYREKV